MKRLFCIIGSLLVCTSSAFAWNAESFLAGASEEFSPYVSDPVVDSEAPMMMSGAPVMMSSAAVMSADTSSSSGSPEIKEVDFSSGILTFGDEKKSTNLISLLGNYDYKISGTDVDYNLSTVVASQEASVYMPESSLYYSWRTSQVTLTPEWPSYSSSRELEGVFSDYCTWQFDLDIDSIGNVLEYSVYIPSFFIRQYGVNNAYLQKSPVYLDLYVNDQFQKRYEFRNSNSVGSIDIANEVISLNSSITSAYFLVSAPSGEWVVNSQLDPNTSVPAIWWSYIHNSSFITYSLLDEAGLVSNDIYNQQAGAALDEHSSIESQWSGSMTDNFNSLNIADFVYPDGLIMAYALISGIFLDLWNALGEYKILYVFPLTLGICLLLIGRISKFGGQASSGSRRRAGGPASKPSGGPSKGGGG